jgi:hypothetical protein
MPIPKYNTCKGCGIGDVCKIQTPRHPDWPECRNYRCEKGSAKARQQLALYRRGKKAPRKAFVLDPVTKKRVKLELLKVETHTPDGGVNKTGYVTLDGQSVV